MFLGHYKEDLEREQTLTQFPEKIKIKGDFLCCMCIPILSKLLRNYLDAEDWNIQMINKNFIVYKIQNYEKLFSRNCLNEARIS